MQAATVQSVSTRVERPWGWYEDLLSGPGYKLKRLLVRQGCRLSLQRHRHRSENWTVVAGSGQLLCDGHSVDATAGSTFHIPCGSIHRAIGGPGDLLIIEVQHGSTLEESDIERLEDDFGRVIN
ncbi:MAG: mannose-6-phosphate isomerase [Synechococcus sp. TMED90]|uniref:phosphomannose isomerase type II C-terminal cupin domain n=1 Tax=Synechococcus sp. MEDNS5 TaxID=1442554 RepID=UPI000B7398E6|nr:phosphomannose isomerase type II C-terminal cupin domain [Synechococcus sp. MEDNS5]OUX72868.1 MAG: mannose-6-phosphate isomerase [Synechococcus sp. TMED90]